MPLDCLNLELLHRFDGDNGKSEDDAHRGLHKGNSTESELNLELLLIMAVQSLNSHGD